MEEKNNANEHGGFQKGGGGTVQPVYTRWCPKVYVIPETTLTEITHFNTEATIFYSISSGLLSIAVGIWIGAAFEVTLNPVSTVLTFLAAPSFIVLSVISLILGLHATRTGKSMLTSIKQESQLVDPE